jgi:bacterioferritin
MLKLIQYREDYMDKNKTNEVIETLNKIMEYELSGVVRYTHYALMITGRDRLSLAAFFKEQANESLLHAQEAGEIVTGLEGHPSLNISIIEESNKHSTIDLLNESSNHEKEAVSLYKLLLDIVKDESIYIEEYARGMIKAEEMHAIEVTKMLKDYAEA